MRSKVLCMFTGIHACTLRIFCLAVQSAIWSALVLHKGNRSVDVFFPPIPGSIAYTPICIAEQCQSRLGYVYDFSTIGHPGF